MASSSQTPAVRSRFTPRDTLRSAATGMLTRRTRAALSALGIAIGIASIVGVLGITESSKAALLTKIGKLGNLLTVTSGQSLSGTQGHLSLTAVGMVARVGPVQSVTAVGTITGATVFRTDRIDPLLTGGIQVQATDLGLLPAVGAHISHGTFLNKASANYPAVVLGSDAALSLGIATTRPLTPVYIAGRWFTVVGILAPTPLSSEIDRSALIGFPVAQSLLGFDGHPTTLYVRTDPDQTTAVSEVLGRTVSPADPSQARVSAPSDALKAVAAAQGAYTSLFVALGAIALLVGGIGVANVMVMGVLERRGEIGLARALGATRRHVGRQFFVESLLLAFLGGATGTLAGVAASAIAATVQHQPMTFPPAALLGGPTCAVLIGAVAGFYPALRASRLSPTEALRSA